MTQITLELPENVSVMEVLQTVDRQFPGAQLVLGRDYDPDWMTKLSPNQRDIVQLLGNGVPARQIAEIAGVKIGTVRTQIQAAKSKLNVGSLSELIQLAKQPTSTESN